MNVTIRREQTIDYLRVEELAREAFWNLYFPGANEHCVVHKMRSHKDFIKELSYVIEVDGVVEGAIFYTHSKVISKDKKELNTISFGPVFISSKYHRQSLGRQLITHTIGLAKEMGYTAIITLGYPYHYKPYGFIGGKKYGISMVDGNYYTGLLVLPLIEGIFDNIKGYAMFSEALEVSEEEVAAFEKNLPYKEKTVQASQREFEIACTELDMEDYS